MRTPFYNYLVLLSSLVFVKRRGAPAAQPFAAPIEYLPAPIGLFCARGGN
jgi:hypothetical protein